MNKLLPIDNVTFWVFVGFLPLWIVWELIVLKMHGQDPNVDLISMVARDRAYQFTALAFAWGSLAAHFWVNWRDTPWHTPVVGVLFFVLMAAVALWDWSLWTTPYATLPYWLRVVRFPGVMLFLGLLNGAFIFPQAAAKGSPF